MDKKVSLNNILLIIFLAALWGGNVTAVRIIMVNGVTPFTVGALRFTSSMVLVFIWAKITGVGLGYQKGDLLRFLPMVAFFVSQISLFNLASKYSNSGRIGVLLTTYPFWLALVSGFFFKDDKQTLLRIVGAGVALVGVICIFSDNFFTGNVTLKGDVIILISALLVPGTIIVQRKLLNAGQHPIKVLHYQLVFSVLCFYFLMFIFERPFSFELIPANLFSILYQGMIVGGVSFIGWQHMLKKYTPSRLSSFFFLVPCFSVLFGSLILHEPMTWGLGIGLALIAIGIYIENRK